MTGELTLELNCRIGQMEDFARLATAWLDTGDAPARVLRALAPALPRGRTNREYLPLLDAPGSRR
jgi:hypothetical protein